MLKASRKAETYTLINTKDKTKQQQILLIQQISIIVSADSSKINIVENNLKL